MADHAFNRQIQLGFHLGGGGGGVDFWFSSLSQGIITAPAGWVAFKTVPISPRHSVFTFRLWRLGGTRENAEYFSHPGDETSVSPRLSGAHQVLGSISLPYG